MDAIELFRSQLLKAEQDLNHASNDLRDAQERVSRAKQAVDAWTVIISQNESTATHESMASGNAAASAATNPAFAGNKTEWVRGVISQNSNTGIAAGQIREYAREAGIEITPQFPYTTLYKLKENGKIRENNGRYYPGS